MKEMKGAVVVVVVVVLAMVGVVTALITIVEAAPTPTILRLQIGGIGVVRQRDGVETVFLLNSGPPVIPAEMGRAFLPLEALTQMLSWLPGGIGWVEMEDRVILRRGGQEIAFWIDNPAASINGVPTLIDASNLLVRPYEGLANQRMLPLRFIAETLGARVFWCGDSRAIIIVYPK